MHGWGMFKTKEQEKCDIYTLNELRKVITISKTSESKLRCLGLHGNNCSTIYNGISDEPRINEFCGDLDLQEIARLKNTGYFIAGVVGTIDQRKNQMLVLRAIQSLPPKMKIKFFFIGEGEVSKLQSFSNNFHLSEKVRFLGYKKNARKFIELFDLLICSSKSEGGPPITLMEAFASKTIVLASNTPEHMEAIIDNSTGFSFEDDNHSDLKNKIVKIFDKSNLNYYKQNAYKFFKQNFLFEMTFKRYNNHYNKLISIK